MSRPESASKLRGSEPSASSKEMVRALSVEINISGCWEAGGAGRALNARAGSEHYAWRYLRVSCFLFVYVAALVLLYPLTNFRYYSAYCCRAESGGTDELFQLTVFIQRLNEFGYRGRFFYS